MMLKTVFPIFILIIVVIGGLFFIKFKIGPASSQHREISEGYTLRDFDLTEWRGKVLPISSLQRKLYIVNFWASWCSACITEMPSIIKLWESYKGKGLGVIVVNLDENPDSVIPKMIEKLKISFPVYLDPHNQLGNLFDVHALPFTVFLDHNLKVLLIEAGERDWNSREVREQVERWLTAS